MEFCENDGLWIYSSVYVFSWIKHQFGIRSHVVMTLGSFRYVNVAIIYSRSFMKVITHFNTPKIQFNSILLRPIQIRQLTRFDGVFRYIYSFIYLSSMQTFLEVDGILDSKAAKHYLRIHREFPRISLEEEKIDHKTVTIFKNRSMGPVLI